ncbi:aliphatic sulfonate ABC transporter substrate-binding protein [Niallia circulans]|jgi:sulfonate transport system substrate-binding protein|uniref:sulfonate ABC transporter substrate-binding protein n=1 Tax=Niallia TaxID=2837506 RepID=UPI000BA7E2D1|nr:sulfonate ABC transporter substrate-binding protein [Niallia circulans]MED5100612.1 sulfonate ABC transporter substrate-binding protein [Niallia circulans]PAE13251.1 aliphatic sulfonate ABC transporter substrate-binding protein [Niallia circulans]
MKKRKKTVALILGCMLLLSTIFLSACSLPKPPGENSSYDKVFRIGYQKNGPLLILKELGTLEERLKPLGYKVEWYEFQAGPALLEALNAGSIDFGRSGDSPPIFAQASDSTLQYVAAGKSKFEGSGILVKNDSSIKTLADLKGKKIGFAKGSSSHYLLVKALEKAGLNYSDIEPAYLSPGDARIAFEKKEIDAWVIWDPFTADTQLQADATLLVNGKGLTSDRDFFLASSDFLQENKEIIKVVMKEIQKSCQWANEHPEDLTKMLSSILGIDEASMNMAVERRVYGVEEISASIIKEQQEIADTFYNLQLIPKKIKVNENVYTIDLKDEEQ